MEALLLKSAGVAHPEIKQICGISSHTLRRYLRQYTSGGVEQLKRVKCKGSQSALWEHKTTIEGEFMKRPPATSLEAMATIERLTQIRRSPSQVREFMKRSGMKFRKVASLPAKVDVKAQADFKDNELMPRLKEAKASMRAVFFVDAAHFVLAPFLGMLWSFTRVFIRAPCGRQRFNVLGALNAVSHELITVTNTGYINSQSVCELLSKIAALGLKMPITLVMDNARYQRCALVQQWAKTLNIEILFLPAYSPNLNLIERLWKFVKKECLYSKYYKDFTLFKTAIETCLQGTATVHKQKLDSLLTLNFQTFEHETVLDDLLPCRTLLAA